HEAAPDARCEPHGRHDDDAGRRHRQAGADARVEGDGRLPDVQSPDAGRLRVPGGQGRAREDPRLQARRLRQGARQVSAVETETRNGYAPRLKELYDRELRARLKDELGLASVMEVPRVTKITLNMGVGEAKTEAKALDAAMEELSTIAGQRPQVRRARKSIA